MITRKWYNWPKGYFEKSWRPWYEIVRAISALPITLTGFSIFYIGVVLGCGVYEAERIRKEIF